MNDDDGRFYGPFPYEPVWLWIGLGLLAAVALWYGYVFVSTRRSRKKWRPGGPEDLPALRRDYLTRIDTVARAHDRGELTARQAHQRLSRLVRVFAHQASGISTHTMTLADLRNVPAPNPTAPDPTTPNATTSTATAPNATAPNPTASAATTAPDPSTPAPDGAPVPIGSAPTQTGSAQTPAGAPPRPVGVAGLADAVAVLYPAEFGVPEAVDADRAVDAARQVVSGWR